MARKRYSSQKKQEQVSRKQFETFLEQHDWITGDIEPDLGEDILVRIYRDGMSTGLSLFIQLKSVKSIADHQLTTGEISYVFDVDDLCHWEAQTLLVLIVIWDVSQLAGWWISITDAIRFLDYHNPGWRNNRTATVRIPFKSRLDEISLVKIRETLANRYWPVISQGKEITFKAKFLFPPTPEGRAKFEALNRTMASGDEIELDGQYIQAFSPPDLWTRIFGAPDPKEMVLWIWSMPSDEILPFQIEFQSDGFQPERISYVEFKRVKEGFEETTLSNAYQGIPLHFDMVIKPGSGAFTLTVHSNYVGLDGRTALQLINIEKMYAQGGKVQFMALKTGKVTQIPIPPGSRPVPEPQFARFVENLAEIQQMTGKALRIPEFATLTFGQMREAQELASIVTTGRYTHTTNYVEIKLLRPGVAQFLSYLPQQDNVRMSFDNAAVGYELLGEQFMLGPCVCTIQGKLSNSHNDMSTWCKQADDKDIYIMKLTAPEITDEYQNWPPVNKEQDDLIKRTR